jgi:hypothetical protein
MLVLLYVKNCWNLKIKLIIQLNVIGGNKCERMSARRLSIQEHLVVLKNRKMSKLKKNFSQTNVPAEILLCPAPAASIWCSKKLIPSRKQAFSVFAALHTATAK